jgi:adenosylcobyric acid synthase
LALLPVETVFETSKDTHQAEARILGGPGWLGTLQNHTVRGYEIHMGHTTSQQPWLEISRRSGTPLALADGAVTKAGKVWGCYLHGLFANETLRRTWLASLGWHEAPDHTGASRPLQAVLDTLALHVAANLDMRRIETIIWGR